MRFSPHIALCRLIHAKGFLKITEEECVNVFDLSRRSLARSLSPERIVVKTREPFHGGWLDS